MLTYHDINALVQCMFVIVYWSVHIWVSGSASAFLHFLPVIPQIQSYRLWLRHRPESRWEGCHCCSVYDGKHGMERFGWRVHQTVVNLTQTPKVARTYHDVLFPSNLDHGSSVLDVYYCHFRTLPRFQNHQHWWIHCLGALDETQHRRGGILHRSVFLFRKIAWNMCPFIRNTMMVASQIGSSNYWDIVT